MKKIVLVFLIIFASISLFYGCKNALNISQDFSMRWVTGKVILKGENPYQMDINNKPSEYLLSLLTNKKIQFSTQYFPSSLLITLPFSLFQFSVAVKIWLIMNILATAILLIAIYILIGSQTITVEKFICASLIFISGTPFRNTLGNGQLPLVSLALFMLSLSFMNKGKWFLSGIFLAVSLLKYNLIFPFIIVFFVLRRKWLAFFVCCSIHLLAHLSLCALMKTSPFVIFLDILKLNLKMISSAPTYDIWSFFRFLNMSLGGSIVLKYLGVIFFISMILTLFFLWIKTKHRFGQIEWLSILSVFALLSSYNRIYSAVFLVFPLMILLIISGFRIPRILICFGVGYFFFLQKIISEIRLLNHLVFLESFLGFILLSLMFYSLASIMLLKE